MVDVKDVERDYEDSSNDSLCSLLTPVVVVPALSFGSILKEFPDFLFCVLPCIADRVVWNSIACSNKDTYKKSKAILPPWPLYYEVPPYNCVAWSPCGTRIACAVLNSNIAIVDQRRGPFRNIENGYTDNYGFTYENAFIAELKFSTDGRYLVSSGGLFVRLWDSRNYEQLQEWYMSEEVGFVELSGDSRISVSACSKYIVVSARTCVFLIDVENSETIKYPFAFSWREINKIMFSSDGCAIFICYLKRGYVHIKVWRPYINDDNEDCLITIWKEMNAVNKIEFSHDNKMVVIHNINKNKGTLYSIDIDHNRLTKKLDFLGSTGLYFTPDCKYIVVNRKNGRPTLWSIAEGTYTNTTIHFLDNQNNYTKHNDLVVKSFSPNNWQCIVQGSDIDDGYITSYFVK